MLTTRASFLAVNTQVNAHNRGFNTISKYPRAAYICISENEIRLDFRSRQKHLKQITREVSDRLTCSHGTITRANHGCHRYCATEGISEVPALTTHIVECVGAANA